MWLPSTASIYWHVQIRLDKSALPAPAVASLYMGPTDSGAISNSNNGAASAHMLSAERALYHAAAHLTWPHALVDDDEYLACMIGTLLLEDREPPLGDRHLPRCALQSSPVAISLRCLQQLQNLQQVSVLYPS